MVLFAAMVAFLIAFVIAAIVVTPLIAVAARASGAPMVSIVAGAAAMSALAVAFRRRVPHDAAAFAVRRPALAVLWLAVGLAAVAQTARISVLTYDGYRKSFTALPGNPFFQEHACYTGYVQAMHIVDSSNGNIYDPLLYLPPGCSNPLTCGEVSIGPVKLDLYQYPPPFLVLPAMMRVLAVDPLELRPAWFFVQISLLAAAVLFLCAWVGGATGRTAAGLSVVLAVAPPTLVGMQIGNFQSTAFALSILGMVALARGRYAAGGLAVGFAAASKLFPGVLGAYLLGKAEWKSVVWIAAGAIAVTLAALMAAGPRPFVDFVSYQLPRINSGEAFFWIDLPLSIPPNYGIHGLIGKLRLLGVPGTTPAVASAISSGYGLLVLAAAFLAGRGMVAAAAAGEPVQRVKQAQVWLALLNLGSFRSPFVPDAYGLMGTLWLLTLVTAHGPAAPGRWALFGAGVLAFSLIVDGYLPLNPPASTVLATLGIQLAALGLNAFIIVRAIRGRSVEAVRPALQPA